MSNSNHGGVRLGAGRKKAIFNEDIFIDECLFPAFCQAFHSDPGPWNARYLSVELSKTDIRLAYGPEGLKMWMDVFKMEKIGGRNKQGIGYKTRWSLNVGQYMVAKRIVETLGHNLKALPNPGFPPIAMQARLDKIKLKKLNKVAVISNQVLV